MRVKLPTPLTDSILRSNVAPVLPCPLLQACFRSSVLPFPPNQPPPHPPHPHRTLTTTPPISKKGGKQESKRTVPLNASKTKGLDPFDFSDLEAAISRAHERLKTDISRIKAGGKDPEVIENVRVRLTKGGKEVVKVGDVASVVVRGRNVAVLVGEKDVGI